MGSDELAVVLVGSDHEHVEAVGGETLGGGADHVVGLVAGHHQHGHVHGPDDSGERFECVYDELGGLGAVGLVFRIEAVAEGASGRVEAHREMGGTLALHEFEQILGETEEYRGVDAPGVDNVPAQEGIVHLEDERMPVNQKKFHPEGI